MKIEFRLDWVPTRPVAKKDFKLAACYALFSEYVERIARFSPCQVVGSFGEGFSRERGEKIWICERGKEATVLSSEALALRLEKLLDSGANRLCIVIGGPDGFSRTKLEAWKPDLRWSFGPLTLPHELAAVVAGEQTYRAWTILRQHPYHLGH